MTETTSSQMTAEAQAERDAETARLLAAHDSEGLRRLLLDHGGKVRWTLRRDFDKVLDEADIDDALSQASQRVWRSGQCIDLTRGTLRAWFFVIARNCVLRVLQSKRASTRSRSGAHIEALSSRAGAPAVSPERDPLVCILHRCIDNLTPQQRAVMLADLAAGGTARTEILMEQLKTTRNTIYVARACGRKSLRAALLAAGHPAATCEKGITRWRPTP